jgi:hypothetical protein
MADNQSSSKKIAALKAQITKLRKQIRDDATGNIDELAKSAAAAEKELAGMEGALEHGTSAARKFTSAFGLADKGLSKFTGDAAEGRAAVEGFVTEVTKAIKPINIFANVLHTVFQESLLQIKALDEASSNLNKTFSTTFGSRLSKSLTKNWQDLRGLGFKVQDLEKSFSGLAATVSDFRRMTEDQRTSLTHQATMLGRFGISAQDYGDSYEYLTEVLGKNTTQAEGTLRSFVSLADLTGKEIGQVASEFAATQGSFARYGDDAVGAFFRTTIAAKRLGIETQTLLTISEGFDTFDSAGESVGTLNALLGGPYLNAIQMIQESDPVKRLERIRDALFMSGRSFADMAEYEQKALAAHIPGINGDVALLGRIMSDMQNGLINNNEDLQNMIGGTSMSVEELVLEATGASSITDIFQGIRNEFALMPEGTMEGLLSFFRASLTLVSALGNGLAYVLAGIAKIGAKGRWLRKAFSEGLGTAGAKTFLKKIPGLSIIMGVIMALGRLAKGDYTGAALEVASGGLATMPWAGTAASIAIDAGLLYSDLNPSVPEMANGGFVPATPGGALVRIAEAGQGEYVVNENQMSAMKQSNRTNVHVTVGFDYDNVGGLTAAVKNVVYDSLNPLW